MKIEMLYPEVANLYGETSNIEYLVRSCPTAEVVTTTLRERPRFLTEAVDFVYMGTMTEHAQVVAIEAMSKYKNDLRSAIDGGTRFLITGNALELFGQKITDVEGEVVECLGLFDFHTTRDMLHRFNSLYVGQYGGDGLPVVGYKSQFTQSYYDKAYPPLFTTERGPGFGPDTKNEGIHYQNFLATYVIGPLFVLNPKLMVRMLADLGIPDPVTPAFEAQAVDAYEARLAEYRDPNCGFVY